MHHIDRNQKAMQGHIAFAKNIFDGLIQDFKWEEILDSVNGMYLQCEVKNGAETDKLISQIKNLFGGSDLDIQRIENAEKNTIILTVPTYVIKEMKKPDSKITLPKNLPPWPPVRAALSTSTIFSNPPPVDAVIWGKGELTNENERQVIDEFTRELIKINEQFEHSLKDNYNKGIYILEKIPDKFIFNSYYIIVNPASKLWELYYVNDHGDKKLTYTKFLTEPDVNKINNALTMMKSNELSPNETGYSEIKEVILACGRAQAITNWDNKLNSILNDLKQKDGITNECIFNQIVGKSLMNLVASHQDKKPELLAVSAGRITNEIVDGDHKNDGSAIAENEYDFAGVIERRFMQNREKKKVLFVLNDSLSDVLAKPDNKDCKFMVSKFSMMHHMFSESDPLSVSAQHKIEFAADLIQNMPNLKTVVMRACFSAGTNKNHFLTKQKKYRIVGKKNNIQNEEAGNDEFLFQQITKKDENEEMVVFTYLKFYDADDNLVVKELKNVPFNTAGNKLSYEVEKNLASSIKEYDLPSLSMPTLKTQVSEIERDWLGNKTITKENKLIFESAHSRARTYVVKKLPEDGLANKLDKELKKRGIDVSVKAYAGPYLTCYPKAGVINGTKHEHQNLPKALKKL